MNESVTVTSAEFKEKFVAFNNIDNQTIVNMLEMALLYISPKINKYVSVCQQKMMIYLLTAHLIEQQKQILAGDGTTTGLQLTNASVDGVSVGVAIPQSRSELDYWLNTTVYGRQLLALLSMLSGIGIYIGGQRENVFR